MKTIIALPIDCPEPLSDAAWKNANAFEAFQETTDPALRDSRWEEAWDLFRFSLEAGEFDLAAWNRLLLPDKSGSGWPPPAGATMAEAA